MRPGQGRLCLRLKLLPGRQARQHLPGTDAGREPGRRQRKGVPGARGEDRRQDRQQDGRQRAARAGHGEERDRGGPEGAVRGLCRRAGLRAGSLPSRGAMPRLHASSCMPVCFWFGVLSVSRLAWLPLGCHWPHVSRAGRLRRQDGNASGRARRSGSLAVAGRRDASQDGPRRPARGRPLLCQGCNSRGAPSPVDLTCP
jgi:hypothetical protein